MYENKIKPYIDVYLSSLGNSKLKNIIEYSVIGGKCIRGFIVQHIIETLSGIIDCWEPIATIELLHTASLIIDDLPCMDNDLFRRGKKSTFNNFGEREAICCALFILTDTIKINFNKMLEKKKTNSLRNNDEIIELTMKMMNEWSEKMGKNLIVGQLMDLNEDVKKLFNVEIKDNDKLIMIYKTSSLFMLSFFLGACYSKILEPEKNKNIDFNDFIDMGLHFGIMFQLMDDSNDTKNDIEKDAYNYVNKYGKKKSVYEYNISKIKLTELLFKNNIYTNEMKHLISIIDNKFNFD